MQHGAVVHVNRTLADWAGIGRDEALADSLRPFLWSGGKHVLYQMSRGAGGTLPTSEFLSLDASDFTILRDGHWYQPSSLGEVLAVGQRFEIP